MTPLLARLTDREEQVLVLLCDGCDYHGVARATGLRYQTVKTYMAVVREKLCASTNEEAVHVYTVMRLDTGR